ncbi:MAG: tetratricopeptide repeat protein, partial [Verrucomicrobia bacterium]
MTTPSTQPPKFGLLRRWWPACLLVAGVFIAFQPAGNAGFIWDDDRYVTHNPLLTSPDGWWRIWFSFDSPSQYFPLTYSLLRVEHGFWGLDAAGYHWTNLLLHAVNAGLLWKFLERLAVPAAGFAAALFALHPVQVETVAWIAEQKNLLSLLFSLLALHAWLSFLRDQTGGWRNYTRALIYFALALFAKTTACTLTIALLLVCWWERKPIHRQRWIQVAPFFAAGLLMGLVTIWWERFHQGTEGKLFHLGLVERVLLASRAMWFYLGKLLWPANLIFSYPKWTIQTSALSAWLWLVAGVLAAAFICALRRRMGRGLAVAAIFFVATLSPLLGFVMLYTFRYTFVADHYQYVACIGPLALAAAVWKFFCERWGRRGRWLQIFGAAGIIALLATLTWRQCGMYRDAETLWRATLARNPGSSLAHNNLGTLLMRSGRTDEAIPHFEAALAAQPDYAVACHNLGRALAEKGLLDAAIARFEQAVRLDPEYPSPRINLGNALVQR